MLIERFSLPSYSLRMKRAPIVVVIFVQFFESSDQHKANRHHIIWVVVNEKVKMDPGGYF